MFRRIVIVFALVATAFAANLQKLILKDGSDQVVQKYEVKGDRVRYYSAERVQWEEIPSSMIDWDATKKLEAQQAAADAPKEVHIPTPEELAKQLEEAQTPEVAPDLRLPKDGGVFVVDTGGAQPRLVELTQNTGQINAHAGKNVLKSMVTKGIAMNTQTIELDGAHSKIQIHTARPAVYINVDESPDDPNASVARKRYEERPASDAYRFKIVKLDSKGDVRVIGSTSSFRGEDMGSQQAVLGTVGRILSGDVWIKIEPKQDLEPGEYAVAEMIGSDDINRFVWDFAYEPVKK